MMPQSKKQKGRRLELETAELIRSYGLDKNSRRMPLSGAFNDPRMKADIITDLPWHIEVKNQESWNPLGYYKQAESVCGGKTPVVVMSRNREQIYCFLLFTDFLQIAKSSNFLKQAFPKPEKKKKTDLTEGLKFSKSSFAHKK